MSSALVVIPLAIFTLIKTPKNSSIKCYSSLILIAGLNNLFGFFVLRFKNWDFDGWNTISNPYLDAVWQLLLYLLTTITLMFAYHFLTKMEAHHELPPIIFASSRRYVLQKTLLSYSSVAWLAWAIDFIIVVCSFKTMDQYTFGYWDTLNRVEITSLVNICVYFFFGILISIWAFGAVKVAWPRQTAKVKYMTLAFASLQIVQMIVIVIMSLKRRYQQNSLGFSLIIIFISAQ